MNQYPKKPIYVSCCMELFYLLAVMAADYNLTGCRSLLMPCQWQTYIAQCHPGNWVPECMWHHVANLPLRARVGRPRTSLGPAVIFLLAVPRRLFCFGSLVILDVARCYLWLFTLYINIKIGKIVVKCLISRWPPVWEMAVHLAVTCDVYHGVFLCCPFSHEVSWMRS